MSLPQFFLENQVLASEVEEVFPLRLSKDDAKHARVLRLSSGEHIAVVDAATIAPTMLEIMKGYEAKHAKLPSQVCFISGPSATADIELVRVEGVHGPMYVHYIVVE